jgi:hypothetical protein
MSRRDEQSVASRFLAANPRLRDAMAASTAFRQLKARKTVIIDGQHLYIIRGDALGNEDDLYLDALAKGLAPQPSDELYRSVFGELTDELKNVVRQRLERGAHGVGG